MKTLKEIAVEEMEKLGADFSYTISDRISDKMWDGMKAVYTESIGLPEKEIRDQIGGVTAFPEGGDVDCGDHIFIFVETIKDLYEENKIILLTNMGIESIEDMIRQTVRHEWRHSKQIIAFREAGIDLEKFYNNTKIQDYTQQMVEIDAIRFQMGYEDNLDSLIEKAKELVA